MAAGRIQECKDLEEQSNANASLGELEQKGYGQGPRERGGAEVKAQGVTAQGLSGQSRGERVSPRVQMC